MYVRASRQNHFSNTLAQILSFSFDIFVLSLPSSPAIGHCHTESVLLNLHGGNDAADRTQGLDRYSWANIGPDYTASYWAHLVMALLVIVFICYTTYVESNCFSTFTSVTLT